MSFQIPWYMNDPRFKPGTVADIGGIRVSIKKTNRQKYNKWRIYLSVRTFEKDGVKSDLKQEIAVAEYPENMTLQEVQKETTSYVYNFITQMIDKCKSD